MLLKTLFTALAGILTFFSANGEDNSYVLTFTDYAVTVSNDNGDNNYRSTRSALSKYNQRKYQTEGLFTYKDVEMNIDALPHEITEGTPGDQQFSVDPAFLNLFLMKKDIENLDITPHGLRGPEVDCRFLSINIPAGEKIVLLLKGTYENELSVVPQFGDEIDVTLTDDGKVVSPEKSSEKYRYFNWYQEEDMAPYHLTLTNQAEHSVNVTIITN